MIPTALKNVAYRARICATGNYLYNPSSQSGFHLRPWVSTHGCDSFPTNLGLQARTDALLSENSCDSADANLLIRDLANAGEIAAVIHVWDITPKREEETWRAIEKLHTKCRKRKGKIQRVSKQIKLPEPGCSLRKLHPSRRLHKIWKGRVLHKRSEKAKPHLDGAIAWLESERSKGRIVKADTSSRMRKVAVKLSKELQVDTETARGLVTKLKQKHIFLTCE